jgi:tRNA-specific 2-thiouridylase
VKDLLKHDMLTLHDVDLLSVGRHFRLPNGSKLVVGRHKQDNDLLTALADEDDNVLTTPAVPGPTAVLRGRQTSEDEDLAAGIVARYSDAASGDRVEIRITGQGREAMVETKPLSPAETAELMI